METQKMDLLYQKIAEQINEMIPENGKELFFMRKY